MSKKKEYCRYELLCLVNQKEKNQEKYQNLMKDMKSLLGENSIEKVEEKNWKHVYKISQLEVGNYLLIYFNAERLKTKELEKNILQSASKEFLNRYLLLNLTDEPKNKIKLKKKDAQQN